MALSGQRLIDRNEYAKQVYEDYKKGREDIPDTFIVKHIFPKKGLFLGYRAWMRIKNGRGNNESGTSQLLMF